MGENNSSTTRVAPVFDQLVAADPTGAGWLDGLVALGSRFPSVRLREAHLRLVPEHGRRWGSSEVALAAPLGLLEHLVQNITEEQVAANKDSEPVFGHRMALARRDPSTIAAALSFLRSGNRGRTWFVLEGESRPDAVLETSDTIIVVEGKRTERSCTSKTKWMGVRSQLIRHMDAAAEAYPAKQVLGLLVVEGDGDASATEPSAHWLEQCGMQVAPAMLDASLPHRSPAQRQHLADGMLGVTTWQRVCAMNNLRWPPFPDVS